MPSFRPLSYLFLPHMEEYSPIISMTIDLFRHPESIQSLCPLPPVSHSSRFGLVSIKYHATVGLKGFLTDCGVVLDRSEP